MFEVLVSMIRGEECECECEFVRACLWERVSAVVVVVVKEGDYGCGFGHDYCHDWDDYNVPLSYPVVDKHDFHFRICFHFRTQSDQEASGQRSDRQQSRHASTIDDVEECLLESIVGIVTAVAFLPALGSPMLHLSEVQCPLAGRMRS
jgi:hypothetical protein